MATVSAKLPDRTAKALRERARREGKSQSELLRQLVEEYLAPPSAEWARALLELPKVKPRRSRPSDVDELTYQIDTTL